MISMTCCLFVSRQRNMDAVVAGSGVPPARLALRLPVPLPSRRGHPAEDGLQHSEWPQPSAHRDTGRQ